MSSNVPKVSVIVPIYKVEKYIEKCAVHLLEQTLDCIEIIFIDDRGQDNSMVVLEETLKRYPERKDSVKIYINDKNMGLVANRQIGIKLATGEFITHCDSDDWVDKNLYETLYNKAKETNADVAICPFIWENTDSSVEIPIPKLPGTCKELLKNWYRFGVGMNHCNKIVRRSIAIKYDLVPYENTGAWEDASFMFRYFYYAGGLTQIDNAFYHYNRTNINATTYGVSRKGVDQMIHCAEILSDFFKSQSDYEDYKMTCHAIQYAAKLDLVNSHFDWLKDFYRLFPESNYIKKYSPKSAFSKDGYIRFWFVKHHMAWLFVLLYKIYLIAIK